MPTHSAKLLGLAITILIALAVLWFCRHVLLLLFAGVLIALILTSSINFIRRFLPIGQGFALAVVLLFLVGVLTALGFIAADPVARQFNELVEETPKAFSRLRDTVQNWSTYDSIENALPAMDEIKPSGGLGKFTGIFSSTLEAGSSLVFVTFSALFLAANPRLYKRMCLNLLPPKWKDDGRDVTQKSICTLKSWLVGQLVSMAVVGVLTGVALGLAGVPLALALGVLAGLAEFIPIVGPLIAAVPALLLAFTVGTDKLLIACAIMLGIQLLEGNVIMPLVQKRAIALPPAVTLASLFVLGGAFGLLGMFVAAPLAAVALVFVDELYLRRHLRTDDRLLES